MAKSNPLSVLDSKIAPEVLEAAKATTSDMLLNLQLSELRKIAKLSQVQLAGAMGITQPTVANLEKEGQNLRLASLKRYVEATGCKLKIDIELPDGTSHGVCL